MENTSDIPTNLEKMTEEEVYKYWNNNDIFNKTIEKNRSKPEYVFYDGPPFATGLPHYGHILAGMIKDSVLRYAHNNGMNVPRFAGFDCVDEDSLINLADGTSIPIKYLNLFDSQVQTLDISEFENKYNPQLGITIQNKTNFFDKGEKECVKLTFSNGNKLICTPEHKIFTIDGWIEASKIPIGSLGIVSVRYINPMSLNLTDIIEWEFESCDIKLSCKNFQEKKKAMGYFRMFGYLISNFNLHHNHNNIDTFIHNKPVYFRNLLNAKNFANDIKLVCGTDISNEIISHTNLFLINLPKILIESYQLVQMGLEFITNCSFPIFLKQEFVGGFLGGLDCMIYAEFLNNYSFLQFGSQYSDSNLNLVINNIIIKLLEQLDIQDIIMNEPKNPIESSTLIGLLIPYKSIEDFKNKIGFRYDIKNSINLTMYSNYLCEKNKNENLNLNIETWIIANSQSYYIDTLDLKIPPIITYLVSIENIGKRKVYDITINNTHNFIANGIIVHNCHGLPIEYEIEKDLGIKTTQQINEFGIDNYNEACRGIVLKYADQWESQMGRLGRWIDFKNQYKTMDLNFMNSVWWVFKNLYDKGRIYEGVKIMGYSTTCGTPLSNFEIQQNYQEVQDDSLFIKIPLKINDYNNKFSQTYILVWTTTPWTLPSNYALCVGANIDYVLVELDGIKYICGEKLIGNIFGKKNPIILDKFKGNKLIGLEYNKLFEFNQFIDTFKIIDGNFVTDSDGTGVVHCFDPNTPILMYDYTVKKIKDIKIGDKVWGDDNKPRNVINLIPKSNGDMYDIKQYNGVNYCVNENHILVLKPHKIAPTIAKVNNQYYLYCRKRCDVNNCHKNCKGFKKIIYGKYNTYNEANDEKEKILKSNENCFVKKNDIFELTVLEYLNICTQDCKNKLRGFKSKFPILENNNLLPIPPYLLGLWLGYSSINVVKIINSNKEIENYCKSINMELSKNKFKNMLENLGILNNKHIPDIYMSSSESNRYLLLAGLIDAKGNLNINKNKIHFEFKQSNNKQKLIEQVYNLAKSLNLYVSNISKIYCNNSILKKDKIEYGEKQYYIYKIKLYGKNILKIPTLIPRKQAFNLCKQKSFCNSNTSSIKILKSIKNEFMGITVDGNGRFLLDDLTIVHNCAPSYGIDDYQVCLDNNLITKESKLFQPLDTNGYVSEQIPSLKGMFYKNYKDKTNQDLNTWVIIELKKKGYYYDKRTFVHNYPFCWRSDTPLIYCAVNSWFIKVEDMRDKLIELNKKINWVPNSIGESRFASWLSNAKDWGISRNRFWGTPIPIWKSETGDIICVGSSYELEKLAGLENNSITDLHRHFVDDIKIVKNGKTYKRVEYVMDCWLESGAMPYGTVGQIGIVELLEKHCKLHDSGLMYESDNSTIIPYIQTDNYIKDKNGQKQIREKFSILPADFIAEGLDQTRGWFYTLLVLSASLFETIPFKNVIVNGLVLAEDGKKMSKRLKNYPDPMEIVNLYGSDALRLYLLGSQATRAEPLKFSKSGVYDIKKDIIIPLTNTIVFWKEYMELYINTHSSNPLININESINKISNPINLWILRKYSELRDEFNHFMKQYNLKNAIGVLYKLVEIMNNGYIKMGRQLIKGKETHDDWIQSLSILSYVIEFILNDFKSVMPFFCESQYLYLKEFLANKFGLVHIFEKSIHLVEKYEFVKLEHEQIAKSFDFDIIYNIIVNIYQMRSQEDISLKKPISQVSLLWDKELEHRYSLRFNNFLSIIVNECNLMEIKILSKEQLNIKKNISPIKSMFFKTYGKDINKTFEELNKMNSEQMEKIILDGEYNGFKIESKLFNWKYDIEFQTNTCTNNSKNLVYKEFNFGQYKDKIMIIMDKSWTEYNDKIYYWRLVATSIQKSRKNAGLHPWDEVIALWDDIPKYELDSIEAKEYVKNITRIELKSFKDYNKQFQLIYSNLFDNIGIKILLVK